MRLILAIAALLLAASCGAGATIFTVGAGTLGTTDKTLGDHVISLYSGKDCSSVRLEKGKTYCKEDEAIVPPQVYCYRTIGSVTCYRSPPPDADRRERVGQNDHNYARKPAER